MRYKFFFVALLLISPGGASSYSFAMVDGTTTTLEDYTGSLVIEIFATWCENCHAQHPSLSKIWDEFQKELTLISLSGSADDTIDDVKSYIKTYPGNWSYGLDVGQSLSSDYNVPGFPTFLFFDKGEFLGCSVGVQEESVLRSNFEGLVSGSLSIDSKCKNPVRGIQMVILGAGVLGSVAIYVILQRNGSKKSN